ncbi:MAG: hypothetical protein VB022_11215 [Rikenellaceae bacterium]|nr:hypothetical protein [Rikenellaceae bacterium]
MKMTKKIMSLFFMLIYIGVVYAQGTGAIGFTYITDTILDSAKLRPALYVSKLKEVVTDGPAYKAHVFSFGKCIAFINNEYVLKPVSSMTSSEYTSYLSSKLSCKPGDVVTIGIINDYIYSETDLNNAIKNNKIETYSMTAISRSEVDRLWNKMYDSWITRYYEKNSYGADNNPDRLLSLDNKNFKKDFASNIKDIYIVNQTSEDKSKHHIVAREVSKAELHRKGYTITEKWNEDPKSTLYFYNNNDYRTTAMVVLTSSADAETHRYSSETDREVARYVDQSGRSITEYRPSKTTSTETFYEVSVKMEIFIGYKSQSGSITIYKLPPKYFSKNSRYNYKFEELLKAAIRTIPNRKD